METWLLPIAVLPHARDCFATLSARHAKLARNAAGREACVALRLQVEATKVSSQPAGAEVGDIEAAVGWMGTVLGTQRYLTASYLGGGEPVGPDDDVIGLPLMLVKSLGLEFNLSQSIPGTRVIAAVSVCFAPRVKKLEVEAYTVDDWEVRCSQLILYTN